MHIHYLPSLDGPLWQPIFSNGILNSAGDCPPLTCENEGYVGKDCRCHCKEGYGGDLCQNYNPAEEKDGEFVRMNRE